MRKLTTLLFIGLTVLGTSCKKYLNINTNPNSATSATPELILPQALTTTANVLNSFNTYGMQVGGYGANAGGYGGFGTAISYNFSSNDYAGLWSATYDNLEDYQAILDYTAPQLPKYNYFNAAARIMKVYDFELLVDAYNNIPYSTALTGSISLTPKYDDAAAIYASLATQLDSAILTINSAVTGVTITMGTNDVLFGGSSAKWKQLANTLKLRLIVHGAAKATFANKTFDAAGFLSTDALINPGYSRDNGKQNPAWNNWAFSYTGGDATKSWIPSKFTLGFYDGHKLTDSGRGRAVYYQYADSPYTGANQLGYENVSVPKCPSGSYWYSGTNRVGTSAGGSVGTLKGPNAGYPVMTAAESYFLQAEAVVRGLTTSTSTDAALFKSGIVASYNYLYQLPGGALSGSSATDETAYETKNSGSYLVNYSLAASTANKIEAIITQKYIALNFVNSQEGWNEYRRTHYPTVVAGGNAYQTFASTVSESTRADKLPTRIMYPTSEGSYNPENVPSGITPFTSTIFWAL